MIWIFIGRKKKHKDNASFSYNGSAMDDQLRMSPHMKNLFSMLKWDGDSPLTKIQQNCIKEGIAHLEKKLSLSEKEKVRADEIASQPDFDFNDSDALIFGNFYMNPKLGFLILKWINYHHNKWYEDKLARIYISD